MASGSGRGSHPPPPSEVTVPAPPPFPLVATSACRGFGSQQRKEVSIVRARRRWRVARVRCELIRERAGGLGEPARGANGGCGHVSLLRSETVVASATPRRRSLPLRTLVRRQREQRLVLLSAGGTSVEVGPQPGHGGVGVEAGELQLDELV